MIGGEFRLCGPCAVASLEPQGAQSASDATPRRAPASQRQLTGEAFISAIADEMEAMSAKGNGDAPTSIHNLNLGISYTP